MAVRPFNIISLCSGGGGLDIGVELAAAELGLGSARSICWVEWDAFAASVLVKAMEAGCMAPAPVWSNLRTFNGRPWRGVVDCLTAGYPCQPFSTAGKRRGADDPRHLWPQVARVIDECQPSIVFLENVGGHVRLGLREVVHDLHGLGYGVPRPLLLEAAAVGASHKRERVFIMAVRKGGGLGELREPSGGDGQPDGCGGGLADTAGDGRPSNQRGTRAGNQSVAANCGKELADAQQPQEHQPEASGGRRTGSAAAEAGSTGRPSLFAPGPSDHR